MSEESKKGTRRDTRQPDEYGAVSGPGTFRIERLLPGPIERLWAYLTEPEKRRKWFARGPMELRTGGRVKLQFRFAELTSEKTPAGKDESCEVSGRVTKCEPPRLLSYTWGEGADASEVTFELSPQGSDVLLVITHHRLGDTRQMVEVASGWHAHLNLLVRLLSGRGVKLFWATKTNLQQRYRRRLTSKGSTL